MFYLIIMGGVFITEINILFYLQEGDLEDPMGKAKQQDNPFIEPSQQHAVVDMKGKFI